MNAPRQPRQTVSGVDIAIGMIGVLVAGGLIYGMGVGAWALMVWALGGEG